MNTEQKIMQLVGAKETVIAGETRTFWTKIGVAFENRDGSFTLRFDYVPAHLADTTIQMRERKPKQAEASE